MFILISVTLIQSEPVDNSTRAKSRLTTDASVFSQECLYIVLCLSSHSKPTITVPPSLLVLQQEGIEVCADPVQDFGIAQVIAHPDYNKPNRFWNDIALLRLDRQVSSSRKYRTGARCQVQSSRKYNRYLLIVCSHEQAHIQVIPNCTLGTPNYNELPVVMAQPFTR